VIQLITKFNNKNEFRPDNTSEDLAFAAFETVSVKAIDLDFDKIIDKKQYKKSFLYFSTIAVVTIIVFSIFHSTVGASLYRIVNFNKSFIPPAPFTLKVEPKNKKVLRGANEEIFISASGTAPEKVRLYMKENQQEEFDEYTLSADSIGTFLYKITSLKNSIEFYAEADWMNSKVQSDTGKITIMDRPFVKSFYGTVNYPRYTKLAQKQIDEKSADITALRGSRVSLSIVSNKELKSAEIIFESQKQAIDTTDSKKTVKDSLPVSSIDTVKYAMNVSGKKASGGFSISKSGTYYVKIKDNNNQENNDPIKYAVVALSDDYPTISLISPVVDVQVTEEALLPIRVAIADDYGFSGLKIYYKLIQSRYTEPMKEFKIMNIPILSDESAIELPYLWDLNKVKISPDDIYEYYIEVADNDIVAGPKTSRTQSLMVKLPSLDEVLNQVDQQQEKVEKDLREVLKKAEDVKRDIQELSQELMKKQNPKDVTWKDKKKAEDIAKQQQELDKKLSEIQKQLENMTENLQQKNAISPETMEKYMELQRLMKEVNSPELKMMQENIQKAMNQVTPEQMQEAMKQVKFDEEKFRKSIERTMNILKRLKAEQKADAITKQAKELEEKQEQLEKQMDNANPNDQKKRDELSKKQEALKEDFKKMAEDMKELEQLLKDLKDMPKEELQEAKEAMQEQETKEAMEDSKQQMDKGDFKNAKKSQQKAKKNMKSFSEKMKKLKDKMQEEGMKEAIRQMQKAISDMLELSERQENVKNKTKSTDYNSTQFQQLLTEQAMVNQALTNTVNNMVELSQKSFAVTPEMGAQLGDALKNMSQSLSELSERNTGQATRNQSQAMSSMNQAIANMQAMVGRMQQSGTCSNPGGEGEGGEGESGQGSTPKMSANSFMDKLQQLANEQQGINNAMQNMGGSGGKSQEEQAKAQRLASQQGQIQKSLEQLAEEQKNSMQRDGKKLGLGSLEKLAEEMKETISEMKQGRVDQNTLKRQERILSRLLDASRSIHERDKDSKREAETGFDRNRLSPGQIDLNTQEGKTRALQELLKSIQQGYTKDYEALIRSYFEALNNDKKVKKQ
jgi:hypothetical protein